MSEDDSRRRHPRIETQQSVWVEGQDVRVSAQARNMSKGGMFVVTEGQAPAIGSMLQITFEDPHEGAIAVKMEVVWRDEKTLTSNVGLRALDSKDTDAFERVVTRYEAAQAPADRPSQPASSVPPASPANASAPAGDVKRTDGDRAEATSQRPTARPTRPR